MKKEKQMIFFCFMFDCEKWMITAIILFNLNIKIFGDSEKLHIYCLTDYYYWICNNKMKKWILNFGLRCKSMNSNYLCANQSKQWIRYKIIKTMWLEIIKSKTKSKLIPYAKTHKQNKHFNKFNWSAISNINKWLLKKFNW